MDQFKLDKYVLFMFTDSVCDCNYTFFLAQISLICLFIQNVDMLIALRSCMTQSCVNPAEWAVSLLNWAS